MFGSVGNNGGSILSQLSKPLSTKELTIEEMSALYERIYDISDRLLKKHNPCNIHKEIQPHHLFPTKLEEITTCKSRRVDSLCCNSCKYWDTIDL